MAAISISWSDLARVAEVSLAFGVGIVAVFALGSLGISRLATVRERGGSRVGGYFVAGAAFATCAAATLYGLYLLIPQFHN
jgi:hypothetical protein